jgi:hypothetical protein
MGYTLVRKKSWDITKIKSTVVYFENGQQLDTKLYNLKYVGQVDLRPNSPICIFSGNECEDCDDGNAIFLFTPAEKKKMITPELAPYDYPGREYADGDSTLLYESRMFYGNVLPDVENGIIWYQNMLTDDGYQQSVYLIKIKNGKIEEALLLDNLPIIDATLQLAQEKKCTEVTGTDFITSE